MAAVTLHGPQSLLAVSRRSSAVPVLAALSGWNHDVCNFHPSWPCSEEDRRRPGSRASAVQKTAVVNRTPSVVAAFSRLKTSFSSSGVLPSAPVTKGQVAFVEIALPWGGGSSTLESR